MKMSTGLANKMLDTGSFKATMDTSKLILYAGVEPASPDDNVTGHTIVATVDNAGAGVTFEAVAVAAGLSKTAAESWSGVCLALTITFFRLELTTDTKALSTTEARVQGTVGLAGADMDLSTVAKTASEIQNIDTFNVALI